MYGKIIFGLALGLLLTQTIFAAGSSNTKNFGGRILTTSTPPITCNSQYGIIWMTPARGSKTPGPFIIESTSKSVNTRSQILGKYETQMDYETCYIQLGPYRINVPTYKIKTDKFNTSLR